MSQMIVFDSPDCTRKTTYANILSDKLSINIPYFFTNQKPQSNNHKIIAESQYSFLIDMLNNFDLKLILDRWIMTEACYSPVLRGYAITYFKKIEDKILNSNIDFLWVYLTCTDEFLEKEYIRKKEDFLSFCNLLLVKEKYESLFKETRLNKIMINIEEYQDDNISKIMGKINAK